MWSHTHYLECLLVAATIAPAELVRVATSFGPGTGTGRARNVQLGVPAAYLAVAGLAVVVAVSGGSTPGYLTAWRTGLPWFAVAGCVGVALVAVEFAVGAAPRVLRGVRGLRLAVAGGGPGASGLFYLASLLLTAAAEELLYRGLWIGTLHERLHLPTGVAICCAAVGYALGHLFFGGVTVIQKIVSGGVFGVLMVASGSLAVPLVAHLGQNLAVHALAARQANARWARQASA